MPALEVRGAVKAQKRSKKVNGKSSLSCMNGRGSIICSRHMYFSRVLILGFKALRDIKAIVDNAYAAWAQICSDAYPDVVVTPPSVSGLACNP